MAEAYSFTRLLIPSHVASFLCSQCGECCTNKWRISVDRPSYDQLYKKLEELGRPGDLDEGISQDKKGLQIRFLNNGKCPYLTNNNQCSLQLELGERYLLDICKVFPRQIFASKDSLEFSLSMTCKTAVKSLLNGPIRIIEASYPVDTSRYRFSFIEPLTYKVYDPDKALCNNPQLTYRILESEFIKLMQNRQYSVSHRLITLGHIVAQLADGDSSQSVDILQEVDSIPCRQLTAEPDFSWQLHCFYQLSNAYLKKFSSVPASQLLRTILLSLSTDKQQGPVSMEGNISKVEPPQPDYYGKLLEQYLLPTISTAELILENYMVNYILNKHFYSKPLHFAYYRMAFIFAAVKTFSVAYSAMTTQPVSQQTILQAIYDVENIFYSSWFFPYISFWELGKNNRQIINNGISLAR